MTYSKSQAEPTLNTEQRVTEGAWIDRLETFPALQILLESQGGAAAAVRAALPQIADAVEGLYQRLQTKKGRLIYGGAGSSGRIAVQDGAELLPTFDWPENRIAYLIAGGQAALTRAIEGAEDDFEQARKDCARLAVGAADCLLILSASGHTPYGLGLAEYAGEVGALRVGIANNANAPLLKQSEFPIALNTGAEVVAGSTRLKAGTAQKICLNMISTQIMVMHGRVEKGLMKAMKPRNEKLRRRHAQINAWLGREEV